MRKPIVRSIGSHQIDAAGRGTTTAAATTIGVGVNAAFYVVSPSEALMMATEPALVVGRAYRQ